MSRLMTTPQVRKITYCLNCTLPTEYCEFNAKLHPKCLAALKDAGSMRFHIPEGQRIVMSLSVRKYQKEATVVKGLHDLKGFPMKDLSKALRNKLSCSVADKGDHLVIGSQMFVKTADILTRDFKVPQKYIFYRGENSNPAKFYNEKGAVLYVGE